MSELSNGAQSARAASRNMCTRPKFLHSGLAKEKGPEGTGPSQLWMEASQRGRQRLVHGATSEVRSRIVTADEQATNPSKARRHGL